MEQLLRRPFGTLFVVPEHLRTELYLPSCLFGSSESALKMKWKWSVRLKYISQNREGKGKGKDFSSFYVFLNKILYSSCPSHRKHLGKKQKLSKFQILSWSHTEVIWLWTIWFFFRFYGRKCWFQGVFTKISAAIFWSYSNSEFMISNKRITSKVSHLICNMKVWHFAW